MSAWGVPLVAAVVAAAAGSCIPRLVARISESAPTAATSETPYRSYAAAAATRGLTWWCAVLSGAAAGAFGLVIGAHWLLLGYVVLAPVLVLLGVVDALTSRIPTVVVRPATAVGVALLGVELGLTGDVDVFVRSIVGMLAVRSLYWLLWFIGRGSMGFGDVRLAALVGLALARLGWAELAAGVMAGMLLFIAWGLLRAAWRRTPAALHHQLPYGPFMIAGVVAGAAVLAAS